MFKRLANSFPAQLVLISGNSEVTGLYLHQTMNARNMDFAWDMQSAAYPPVKGGAAPDRFLKYENDFQHVFGLCKFFDFKDQLDLFGHPWLGSAWAGYD